MEYHLAQLNLATFKAPLTDPQMKEFVAFLEPVNQFAESCDGFVWRLKDEQGRSSSYIESLFENDMMAVNLSVWESLEALQAFVYGSVHSYFLRHKKKWFDLGGTSKFILWWLPAGELPTLDMARELLDDYNKNGSSPRVFDPKDFYGPNGLPIKIQRP